jgi:hypothetical protein
MTTTADFLNEGAKSYIDALAAVEAFEGKVRRVCKDAYEKYKPELVSKMGLKDAVCKDHDNTDPANGSAELGVLQSTKSGREWFYVYLKWDGAKDGSPEISACVSLEFIKRSDRDDYARLLPRTSSIKCDDDDDGYYLWSHKNLTDLSSCSETFYELLDEWLACWPAGRRLK